MQSDRNGARQVVVDLLRPALQRRSMTVDAVDDELNLIDSGLFDSLGFLQLIADLEHHAGVQLDLFDVDPDTLTTVGGLILLICEARDTQSSIAEHER